MNSIIADSATRALFHNLDQLTEVRDDRGALIGYVAPVNRLEELLYLEAAAHFDPQAMERRVASGKPGLTTQEALDRLKALETP
jgi:hypothetical protein